MNHEGLKRQGSLYVLAVLCVAVAAAVVVPRLWPQAVQACTEYTRAFGENFDTVDLKDLAGSSVAGLALRAGITLPRLGSNFVIGAADRMGRRIYQCASGDFTGRRLPRSHRPGHQRGIPRRRRPLRGPSSASSGASTRPTWAPAPLSRRHGDLL